MMRGLRQAVIAALFTMACLVAAPLAFAAEEPYEYDPLLSLVGNCDTSAVDMLPDPGCPDGTHPPSGHFSRPAGVTIDSYGNEYVAVRGNESGTAGRIDIFDDEGNFISEIPDPHGPTTLAVDTNGVLYVYERIPSITDSEVVRYHPSKYEPEAGEIEYDVSTRTLVTENTALIGSLAVDTSTDRLYVMFATVQEFASAEELVAPDEPNPLLDEFSDPRTFQFPVYIAVDGQRQLLFVSSCLDEAEECGVFIYKADPPFEFVAEIDGSESPGGRFTSQQGRLSVAVDEESGHIFVEDAQQQAHRIVEFGPDFKYVSTIDRTFLTTAAYSHTAVSNSILNPAAANLHNLFVPVSSVSGIQEVFAFHPSDIGPPVVDQVSAAHLSETEGALRATVDSNGAATKYVFTLEEEGSGEPRVVGEGTVPATALATPVTAALTGLRPGASYRFEVEVSNVKGTAAGEGSFATYADAPFATGSCPNEGLRMGPSSALPDCRAFELVTPADTNGRPVRGGGYPSHMFSSPNSSLDGNALTFMTEGGALPGTNGTGSLDGDRYRATRGATGWSTSQFGPTGAETETPRTLGTSPDQGFGFWEASGEGTAVIGGIGNNTRYIQYPDGHSELVGLGSLGEDPRAVGHLITENATHVIFQTESTPGHPAIQLEPNAPPGGTEAVYDRTSDGVTHVVSLLPPDDTTPPAGEDATFVGASIDGAGIAFRIDGSLYLRRNNDTTFEIGKNVAFAGVSEGGRRIFYMQGGNLLAFDADSGEVINFTNTGNAVVVNVAPSGNKAYFVSTTAIAAAEENPNGALPLPGQRNLYLSEEGQIRFVGAVTKRDVEGEVISGEGLVDGLGLWSTTAQGGKKPSVDPSRVNPTGSVLVFQSRADLDGHAADTDPQIYRYDSEANRLHCISCNPTKTVEGGGASLETFGAVGTALPPIGSMVLISNITPDGKRAVFESKEALVSTDNDGVQDVYEWEESGVGSCTRAGGCVYLLSSSHSADENFLFGMSRNADDVFFVTRDVLVGGDNDLASVYDARVGGGFPIAPEGTCIGEACRPGMTSAPALTSPGSPARGGHDNFRGRKCPKGKRKVKRHGKVRCVKTHRKGHGEKGASR
jgi:hypothetical protein